MRFDTSKRYYHLKEGEKITDLEKVADANALIDAFYQCTKESRWKEQTQKYEANLLSNTLELRRQLLSRTYHVSPPYEFIIHERGKIRNIKALTIRDKVIQRSLCDNVLIPKLTPYLIYDNGASMKDKGISFARKRIMKHLRSYLHHHTDGYILQTDFTKFFESIPHKQLLNAIKEKITDPSTYYLIEQMIGEYSNVGIGLGLGAQISQISGVFYPTPLDNYCKIVKGIRYYGRYMDDIYVISDNKQFLKQLLEEMDVIVEQLGLKFNRKKTHISKLSHGFTFLKIKYKVTKTKHIVKTLSRDSIVRERRKLKKYAKLLKYNKMSYEDIENAYKSWRGNVASFDSYRTLQQMDDVFYKLFHKNISSMTSSVDIGKFIRCDVDSVSNKNDKITIDK